VRRAQDHAVTIERRGRSHRALCACGWESRAWNELRPAEADAWHHVYGEDVIIDVAEKAHATSGHSPVGATAPSPSDTVGYLVRKAQDLAGEPSPYGNNAHAELWDAADYDTVAIRAAIAEVEELLAGHNRQSLGAADSEWLELMTAKRLLLKALDVGEQSGAPSTRL
jgi:hypothetical protein